MEAPWKQTQGESEVKYTESDRQLVRQQLEELKAVTTEISQEDFFKILYPGQDLEKVWLRYVQSNGKRKNVRGLSQIRHLSSDIETHHVLAYGQGTRSADISSTNLLFYEDDSLPTERSLLQKLDDLKKMGLPEPTIMVPTGGKSIHFYWVLKQFYSINRVYEVQVQMYRQAKYHHDFKADGWDWHDEQQNSLAVATLRTPGFMHNKTLECAFACNFSGEYYDIENFETLYPVEKRIGAWQWNDRKDHSKGGFWLPYKSPEQRQAEKEEKQRQDEQRRKEAAERRKKHAAYYGEDYDQISFNGTISLLGVTVSIWKNCTLTDLESIRNSYPD